MLFGKPEVVSLTKADESTKERISEVVKRFKELGLPVISCSILDDESMRKTKEFLQEQLAQLSTS
jgi:hypothetical protein